MQQQGMEVTKTATTTTLTPRRAVGLMLPSASELTQQQATALREVCQVHPLVKRLYTLFQDFVQMLRHRRGEALDQWARHPWQPRFFGKLNSPVGQYESLTKIIIIAYYQTEHQEKKKTRRAW